MQEESSLIIINFIIGTLNGFADQQTESLEESILLTLKFSLSCAFKALQTACPDSLARSVVYSVRLQRSHGDPVVQKGSVQ